MTSTVERKASVASSKVESLHVDPDRTSRRSSSSQQSFQDADSGGFRTPPEPTEAAETAVDSQRAPDTPTEADNTITEVGDASPAGPSLSMTEITDGITDKLNEILMEVNRYDKEMTRIFGRIDTQLGEMDDKLK